MGNCNLAGEEEKVFVIHDTRKRGAVGHRNSDAQRASKNERTSFSQGKVKEDHIYDYAHEKVIEILLQKGKYEFPEAPESILESRPLKIFRNDDRYLGQWDPLSNTREGQGVFVCFEDYIYEGSWK